MIDFDILYKNRDEAYERLCQIVLESVEYDSSWKILTTTINNLKQIDKISKKMNLDYEPFFLENIKAPKNSECVIASLSELKDIVIEENLVRSFEIDEDYIFNKSQEIYENCITKKLFAYKGGRVCEGIEGRNFFIFSDGCDIGLDLMCCVKSLLNAKAKKIFLCMPVISSDLYDSLDMIVDGVIAGEKIVDFIRTSYYYEDFDDIDIEEVQYILTQRRRNVE